MTYTKLIKIMNKRRIFIKQENKPNQNIKNVSILPPTNLLENPDFR